MGGHMQTNSDFVGFVKRTGRHRVEVLFVSDGKADEAPLLFRGAMNIGRTMLVQHKFSDRLAFRR